MENNFTFVLFILTFITGISWILVKITIFFSKRNKKEKNLSNYFFKKFSKYNFFKKLKYIEYFSSIFPVLLTVFITRSFIVEPFKVPSGSMIPTILIGDFILVNKFSYNIRNPINQRILIKTKKPKYGDVVVFKCPFNTKVNYIKRIIGIPGDYVIYDFFNKKLIIFHDYKNNILSKKVTEYIYDFFNKNNLNKASNLETYIKKYNFIKKFNLKNKIEINNANFLKKRETLGNSSYDVLINTEKYDQLNMYYKQPECSIGEWIIPDNNYFVMGDNRDNSYDSRYWGFVPEENLIGKATIVWMSIEKSKNKIFTNRLRLNHLGIIK